MSFIARALMTQGEVPVGSFLSHFDGTDGSTTITDEYGNACTAFGNAQIDTAQSKFGGASLLLDGTDDYVNVASFADATPGSSDWIAECWIRPTLNNALKAVITKRTAATTNGGYAYYVNATGNPRLLVWNDGAGVVVNLTGSVIISTNTWHHFGILKIGTLWGQMIDGVIDGTATETGVCGTAGTEPMRFGRDAGSVTRDFNGHIDECRIVKGIDVADIYPNALTSLTYTVPTLAFEKG